MLSNLRFALCAGLLAVGVASCGPPESQNPLSDPAQAKPDARLTGLWSGEVENSPATLQFFPKQGPFLDVVLTGNDGEKGASVLVFDAFPTLLNGKTYLNLRAKSFRGLYSESFEIGAAYLFVRYDIAKDGSLTLLPMDDEPVKVAVAAGKLKGTVKENSVKLTASTKELAEYVRTADPERLFKKLATFRKLK